MMRWLTASAAFVTLASAGQAEVDPAAQAPAALVDETQIDEVAIARDRHERMTVPVTIDGQGPYRFFIDTGAQATVVTHAVTDDLRLEPTGMARLVAMGSSRTVQTVELDDLEFANRTVSGLTAPLLEAQHVGADGILGLDTLQDLRVLIDFREGRLTVAAAQQGDDYNEYEIVVRARRKLGQMIITDARVNNVRTAVIIDTGSQITIGNRALFQRLRAKEEQVRISTDVNGVDLTSDLAFINRLTIGEMDLTEVPIGFADSPAFAAMGYADRPALILGMGNLRVFDRVAIDFSTRKILFDLSSDAQTSPFRDKNFFPYRSRS